MKAEKPAPESFSRIFLARFRRDILGMGAFFTIIALILIALLAPFIVNDKPIVHVKEGRVTFPGFFQYPEYRAVDWNAYSPAPGSFTLFPLVRVSPTATSLFESVKPPSGRHFFGTDDQGMDVFARIIWGTRVSITIGIVSAVLTLLIGTLAGALAGYFGGWIDVILSRIMEIMMCFPTFFLILAVLAFLPPSIYNIMIVIGLTEWTGIARLVRGEVLRVKNADYVKAARISGQRAPAIIARHILPNSLTPALIAATFNVSSAILVESSLSFLGFGVQPPTPSWGAIIQVAYQYMSSDNGWWLALFPGIAIFITVTSYNLLGQSIRDAADPRLIS